MELAEFDRFVDEYLEQHCCNLPDCEDRAFFAQYKVVRLKIMLDSAGLMPSRIIDFGSGIGGQCPFSRNIFRRRNWFAPMYHHAGSKSPSLAVLGSLTLHM
jgi:hypothetical protein